MGEILKDEPSKNELTRSEIINLVANQSGKFKKDVSLILDVYYLVIRECILAGLKVTIPGVCSFSNSQSNPKPEREAINPNTGEKIIVPAHEAFNKPICRFKPGIKTEMREKTEGRVI